jgi:hypothetical protein
MEQTVNVVTSDHGTSLPVSLFAALLFGSFALRLMATPASQCMRFILPGGIHRSESYTSDRDDLSQARHARLILL